MNRTLGRVLVCSAVAAAGATGAIAGYATMGSAATGPTSGTAAVVSNTSGATSSTAATSSVPASAPAVSAPAASAGAFPAAAFPAAGRGFPMANTPTSTADCPNMGSGGHPGPASTPAPSNTGT